ncbi:hypothetical protein [Lysinibacillus sp. G4S2]|uniref:hypothetical protein n=1 Tax=Lysinibacillus sp. G4S2 TaxID=3055859 RepID=UPI0025A085ED|nr:hypothetical protein [Lysinibacillus sp. G4S2]MDM5249037.1 hypothetical protein [Lysinibacillus sp. G4S2]
MEVLFILKRFLERQPQQKPISEGGEKIDYLALSPSISFIYEGISDSLRKL